MGDFDNGEWIEVFGSSTNRCLQDPTCYTVFELSEALLISAIFVWSIYHQYFNEECLDKYLMNLTYWCLTLEVIYFWLSWFTTHRANAMKAGTVAKSSKMPWHATMTWVLQDLLIPGTCLVFLLYWILVAPVKPKPLPTLTYFTHGVNFFLMMADVYVNNVPYFLLHGIYFSVFGVVYLLFTIIYWLSGGTDCHGKPYIYKALDWNKPQSAATIATLLLFVVLPILNVVLVYNKPMLPWVKNKKCY